MKFKQNHKEKQQYRRKSITPSPERVSSKNFSRERGREHDRKRISESPRKSPASKYVSS